MSEALPILPTGGTLALPGLEESVEGARAFARESLSQATRRAYATDARAFQSWWQERSMCREDIGDAHVALHLSDLALAGRSWATIQRRMTGLVHLFGRWGRPSPRNNPGVMEVYSGIARSLGKAPKRQAPAMTVPHLRQMAALWDTESVVALRNRVILIVGWAGALRRSELASLALSDVEKTPQGYVLRLRKSKTDQLGRGRLIGLPYGSDVDSCPCRALEALYKARTWVHPGPSLDAPLLLRYDTQGGAAFTEARAMSPAAVGEVVKASARYAGLAAEGYTGHSLRAGFVTAAVNAGKPMHAIMAQTGHATPAMVLRYARKLGLFDDNAAAGLL